MRAAEIAVSPQSDRSAPISDEAAWRAQMLQADVAALSDLAGDLQSLVQQMTALLGQVGASKRSAVAALAARLQALSIVLSGVARHQQGLERGAPATLMSGQIQAAIAALGGAVGPTGIVRSWPGADAALTHEIARLQSALASVRARLQSLLARLGERRAALRASLRARPHTSTGWATCCSVWNTRR
jgi:uncharacterized protein YlxW (UPF0749 family)